MNYIQNTLEDIISVVTPKIENSDESIMLFNSCLYFDIAEISKYYLLYFCLLYLFQNNKRSTELSALVVSSLVCWKCILFRSHAGIVSYYWYDLFLMIHKKDKLMILHHLFSLYSLNTCSWDPDYERIYTSLFLLKTGDLFLHHYKISDIIDIPKTKWVYIYQLVISFLTLVLWIVFRIILPFGMYPFYNKYYEVSCMVLHIVNFLWVVKLYFTIERIYYKLITYDKYNVGRQQNLLD
jgi:hypothetical protein